MKETQNKQHFSHVIASVTVANSRAIAPYIDTFSIVPQNIIERDHGSLVGFFRIYDESEENAYIANFLTSIVKKEFYASMRHGTEKAFETALAKVNMALGELARQNTTQWIGKIDGAVCVFTKTSVCFSSCGHASILLFRNNALMRINTLPNDDETPSILSTFSDIACGPLQEKDTFIIASREIENVLPHDECERACLHYTDIRQREQLFRTALVNQTDGSCVHIVEVIPKRTEIARRSAAFDVEEENITIPENVFSAQAFATNNAQSSQNNDKNQYITHKETLSDEENEENMSPGHIYLQGDETDTQRTPFNEVLREYTFSLRTALRRNGMALMRNLQTLRTISAEKSHIIAKRTRKATCTSFSIALAKARALAQKARIAIGHAHKNMRNYIRHKENIASTYHDTPTASTDSDPAFPAVTNVDNVRDTQQHNARIHSHSVSSEAKRKEQDDKNTYSHSPLQRKIREYKNQKTEDAKTQRGNISALDDFYARTAQEKDDATYHDVNEDEHFVHTTTAHISNILSRTRTLLQSASTNVSNLLPHPRRAIASLRALTLRQQIIAGAIIAIIIVGPLIFNNFLYTPQKTTREVMQPTKNTQQKKQDAHNANTTSTPVSRAYTINKDANTITLVSLRGETYVVTPQKITHIINAHSKRDFAIPQKYRSQIVEAVAMNDLNMIFLRTKNNTIISFTPKGLTKFKENNITIPKKVHVDAMATYLTYLYLFDSSANNIYRYPRVPGGFGDALKWLTDDSEFNTPRSIVIDGTIYLADRDGTLSAFFSHKKIQMPSPQTEHPLHADALFTSRESAPLFILDRSARRIVALNKKSGAISVDITNDDFATARSFTVNERLSTIALLLDDGTLATYRY